MIQSTQAFLYRNKGSGNVSCLALWRSADAGSERDPDPHSRHVEQHRSHLFLARDVLVVHNHKRIEVTRRDTSRNSYLALGRSADAGRELDPEPHPRHVGQHRERLALGVQIADVAVLREGGVDREAGGAGR